MPSLEPAARGIGVRRFYAPGDSLNPKALAPLSGPRRSTIQMGEKGCIAMSLPSLVLLMLLSSAAPGTAAPTGSIERIVVVLGEKDPVSSSRVLRQLKSCTDGIPTAVVSAVRELRIERDFSGSFSLAPRIPSERIARAETLPASLQLLAEALAPVGPTTAIVLVSPQVGADSGIGAISPDQPSVEGAETPSRIFYDTVEIPAPVLEARKALRKSGLTVVAVNTSRQYDAGAKALTEIPKGRYLSYSQRDFQKKFVSAVCAPGR
jgi:hypothetical protein